ncbi:MAG: hypothetical protein ABJE95_02905 [Byssovorax sp.]
MDIIVAKGRLRPVMLAVMAVIVAAGVVVEVLRPIYDLKTRSGVVPLFSLSYEQNIPTFYSAILLLACSLLLALVATGARAHGERSVRHWWVLSAGFLYIAFDEMLEFHEQLSKLISLGGVLHFSWIVPAGALVLLLGIAYVPFLRALPRPIALRFVIAGAVYVGGAVGMELPLGWWTVRHGEDNLGYGLIDALEESLEMLGLNLFLFALLDHLAAKGWTVRFIREKKPAPAVKTEPAP